MSYTTITGPGRVAQFLWGARQQNTLTFAYPVALDQARFWREPQAGSELEQVNPGQGAWVTTRDFKAAFTARWLGPRDWAAFQAFLDWAVIGGLFSLVPDAVNAPLYVLPGCLLVDPFDKPTPTLEANGLQALDIIIRNPTYDLGLSWR